MPVITGRPSGSSVALPKPEVEGAENPSLIDHIAEHNETINKVEDSVWTGAAALDHGANILGKLAGSGNQARALGFVTGAAAEVIHPTPKVAGDAVEHVAEALGEHGSSFTGTLENFLEHTAGGKVLDAGLKGAAVADVAFNVYKDLNDTTFNTTAGKVTNAAVDAGVTALMFTGPVGDAIMATELVTGGGVSGSAKGIVAMGEGIWTGDDSAVEKWTEGAKQGEYGWLIKAGANNETVSAVAGAVGSVVAGTAVAVAKPIVEGVEALADTAAGKAVIGEVKREAAAVGDAAVALANSKAGKAVGHAAVVAGEAIADTAVAVAHSAVGQEVAREAKVVGHAAVVAGKAIGNAAVAVANSAVGKEVTREAKVVGNAIADTASAVAHSVVGKAVGSGASEVGHAIQTGAHAVTAAMKELPKLEDKAIHAVGKAVSTAASAVSDAASSVAHSVSHAWNALLSW